MPIAPNHIKNNCFYNERIYLLSEFKDDEYSFVYQVKCVCGCEHLNIYMNDTPKVIAACPKCGNEIPVYDLTLYPTSAPMGDWVPSWLAEENKLSRLQCSEDCELFVNYQYGYCVNDEDFNENDVTGFNMWIYENGEMSLIIDDETA